MPDHLVRALIPKANLRALACVTTDTASEACRRHGLAPTAAVALGRALSAGALMGALLKGNQRVALTWEGSGPLRKIVVQANARGEVHGYVAHPEIDLPLRQGRFDVAGAMGAGVLTVTKDLLLKTPYQGMVHLVSGEIAEDLAYYLTESEQIPSAVGLTAIPDGQGAMAVAGGFLIQSLPPASMEAVDAVLQRIAQLPPLGKLLSHNPSAHHLLETLFAGMEWEDLGQQPVAFRCSCSPERVGAALRTLGAEELARLAARNEPISIRCQFCGQTHVFGPRDLEDLARLAGSIPEPPNISS